MIPGAKRLGLLGAGLFLLNHQRTLRSRIDGDVASGSPANRAGQHGSLFRFAGNGRYSEQVAMGVEKQIGKADRVVDISADVGIEKNFCRHEDSCSSLVTRCSGVSM